MAKAKTEAIEQAQVEIDSSSKLRAQRQFGILFRAYETHKRYEMRVLGQAIVILSMRAAFHEKDGEIEARDALREIIDRLTEVSEAIESDNVLPETEQKNHSSIV